MRRRLTVAMVVMVLATLLLSGVVSLLVAQRSALTQTRRELLREGQGLAVAVQQEAETGRFPAQRMRTLLVTLRSPLRLDSSAVLALRAGGRLFDPIQPARSPALPAGLTLADLQPSSLAQLQAVTGRRGSTVFAAVPYETPLQIAGTSRTVTEVVVLTRRVPSAFSTAGPWFGLSALLILAAAALVAGRLGRRFVAPLESVREVAGKVAAGDLTARAAAPSGGAPELSSLVSSINAMAAALGEAKAAEQHFLQSISHDLRTPLTSIRGYAEAIEDGATDAGQAATVIASEARRLQRLVADLLGLATLEAKRFTLQPQPVDLGEAVALAATGFLPSASQLGLELHVEPASDCVVTADPDRLGQVIANLIENALRYAARLVRVGVTPTGGGHVELWVADDGPGIASVDLPRVFDRLFEARPRPDRPIGSGLGLAIVAQLAAAMGGSVRAESPVAAPAGGGSGTRMVVSLPFSGPQTNSSVGNDPPSTFSGSAPITRSSTVA